MQFLASDSWKERGEGKKKNQEDKRVGKAVRKEKHS